MQWQTRCLLAALMLPLACSGERTEPQKIPVPPGEMSDGARAFYDANPQPVVSIDLSNPAAVAATRADIETFWRRGLAPLGLQPSESLADIAGVAINRIRFADTKTDGRLIVYLHGGGFVVGSRTANIVLPSRVANASGMPVVSIDYRMPPDDPFPAAVDDAVAVIRALLEGGQDPGKLVLMGESAGGGLVLSAALRLKAERLPMPAGLIVLSPWADLSNTGDTSLTLTAYDPVINWPMTLASAAAAYAGDVDRTNPLISPVFGDYHGLPPMLVQAGGREVLLSDAFRVVRRAREAGVAVRFDVWDGMWHVFQEHPEALEAKTAVAEMAHFALRVTGGASLAQKE